MDDNNENNLEIYDPESYRGGEQQHQFSHQGLVMTCMRNSIEAGSHEMRVGWFNMKYDKFGNISKNYVEDTRLRFIESVKTLIDVMYSDFDDDSNIIINQLLQSITDKKNKLLDDQYKWYINLTPREKATNVEGTIIKDAFNTNEIWYQYFMEFQVDIYRKILRELGKLSKRLNYYQEESLEV